MVKFVQGCIKSDNHSLKLLSDMALRGSGSHFSKSCNYIMASYNLTYCDFYKYSHHHSKSLFENQYLEELDPSLLSMSSLVRDILQIDHTDIAENILRVDDLNTIVLSICTQ